jgi:predicted neutral ceramidase superfamily lipid hydrolase
MAYTLCQEMKPEHTRKLLGAFAALFGAWWTWIVVVPSITRIWSDGFKSIDVGFLLTIVPWMAIPGVLSFVFGVRLFREMQESSLKWVIGVFAVFFAIFLSSIASEALPSILPDRLERSAFLFVASLIAFVAYLFALRFLIRHLTHENRHFSSLLGRGALILMAGQVWLVLSEIFEEYSPIKEGYTHVPEEPWGILGLVVPILIAFGLYRTFAQRLAKAQQGVTPNA